MSTPFERGKEAGKWADEEIQELDSIQKCLERQERIYQNGIDELLDLYKVNPEYARQQAEYMEGWINSARQSLRGKIGC